MYNWSKLKTAVRFKKRNTSCIYYCKYHPGAEVPKTVCKAGALSCHLCPAVNKAEVCIPYHLPDLVTSRLAADPKAHRYFSNIVCCNKRQCFTLLGHDPF